MGKKEISSGGLTKKHWFGYMCGDWGGCMTFALMGTIATQYYVNALQIDEGILAILLFIWNVWDAVNDPIMGAIMDKVFAKNQSPKGKFRPWILRSTPLVAITAAAFWIVPTFFEGTALLLALFVCKILYEGAYTMFNIPMGSLISAMSKNDSERASLSAARGVGSMFGNMIPGILGLVLLDIYGEHNFTGYMVIGGVCAAIGFVVCLMHYMFTEERTAVGNSSADDIKFTDILTVFKKNRPFVALCIHGICICTMQYVGSTINSFLYTAYYGGTTDMAIGTALSTPFMIATYIFVPMICKKLGLDKVIRFSLLIGGGIYIALFGAHMVTYVDPILHSVISGVASGIAMVSISMQWGLVGEAIDYNEMITGKRTEGSIYGTFNLTRRIGQAVGNSAAVLALKWIGYDKAEGAIQTAETITGLKILCVLVPAVFILGSWFAFKFVWNITPEVRAKISASRAENNDDAIVPELYREV